MTSPTEKPELTKPRRGLIIFAGYLILSIILSWPLTAHLTTHLPFGGDAYQTIWDFYWLNKCLTEGGDPFFTNLMFAPEGIGLALHDMTWLNSLPSVPLQIITGNRILVFNLLWMLALSLSGYFMYLYARRHLGDGIPAFAAGCMFAFSTYHLHHGAQLGNMWIGWLPLFQIYLEESLSDKNRIKATGKAAIVLAIAGYTHWYTAAFCLFQLLFTLIWTLITTRPFNAGPIWRSIAITVCGAVLLMPILLPAMIASGKVENEYLKIEQREMYGADLGAMVMPSPRHPVYGNIVKPAYSLIKGNITESPIYPGWVLWILFLMAMLVRNPMRGRLLFLSLCFLILALGTKPHAFGGSLNIPLPYTIMAHIPGLDFIRVPSRFIAPALVFLSLAAAQGLTLIGSRIPNLRTRNTWIIVVILLALFDTTILPLPTRDASTYSEFYTELAADKADTLIFDYPSYTFQEYLYYQTIHGKPIISGYGVYLPPERAQWIVSLNDEPWKAEQLGIRYVIFHKGFGNPSQKGTITVGTHEVAPEAFFDNFSGYKLIHDDRYVKVYDVYGE